MIDNNENKSIIFTKDLLNFSTKILVRVLLNRAVLF